MVSSPGTYDGQESSHPIGRLLRVPEILLLIFDILNTDDDSSRTGADVDDVGDGPGGSSSGPNTSFPFALACVCRQWLDLVCSVSAYWRTFVLVIDSPVITPSIVRQLVGATKQGEIEALRLTSTSSCPLTPDEENSRIAFAMSLLLPHVWHCTRISLSLHYRSSLIVARRYIPNAVLRQCRHLELSSAVADSTESLRVSLPDAAGQLRVLAVDARTFLELFSQFDRWPVYPDIEKPRMCLRILRSRPLDESSRFISRQALVAAIGVLNAKTRLSELSVSGSEFHPESCSTDSGPIYAPFVDSIKKLKLEDVDGVFISTFYAHCNFPIESPPEETTITRCALLPSTDVQGDRMAFSEMDLEHAKHLPVALAHWRGTSITFERCGSAFVERMLGALAYGGKPEGSRYICEKLESVRVEGCEFEPRDLKRMLKIRRKIRSVRVCGGPGLNEEDKEWLDANLDEFAWARARAEVLRE